MRNPLKIIFNVNLWIIITIAAEIAAIVILCLFLPSFLPLTLTFALSWLLSLAAAIKLLSEDGSAEVKCGWFALICVFPVGGALIYFFMPFKKRPHAVLDVKSENETGLSRAANLTCGTAAAGYERAKYFSDGGEFWQSALKDINGAQKTIYIEFFIISRGKLFNEFCDALKAPAERGAEIKIITDGLGSALRVGRKEFKKLKEVGAKIKVFHRLLPFPSGKINLRDHRKIIAVDGKTAYTGGVNLADEYVNAERPYGFWKDNGVAVYGEAAKIFEGMFLAMWNGKHEMPAPAKSEKNCLPFYDSPRQRFFCEDAFVQALCTAKERVHIFTPYFCLSEKTAAALTTAARRGADVKVIIPHIPDKKYAFEVSKSYAQKLDGTGVEFYEFTPGFMHAKCLIADGRAFLGSYNFDFRSSHFNYECGATFCGEICDEAEKDFLNTLTLSAPLSKQKPSLPRKIYRFILKLFSPLI